MKHTCNKTTMLIISTLLLHGCGGSSSSPSQKSAQLTFALVSTAQPRVESLRITVDLPPGVSVATKSGSNELEAPAVQGRNSVLVMGTYSSAVQRVNIVGVKPDGLFGPPNNASYNAGGVTKADAVILNCTLSIQNPLFSYSILGGSLSGGNTALQDQTSHSTLSVTYGY